ncbi:MAG: hypothetical protein IH606_15165 [Burkholderiales bacterium]|nr:hypothetical protein [Burkholderiales bacterium]
MNWRDFAPQGMARWIAAGSGLAGVAGIILSQTLLSPSYEVLYGGGVSVAYCANTDGKRTCTFHYEFSIGNTGKLEQESLRIEWPLDLRHLGVGTQAADIVGSARETVQPQILTAFESGKTVYTINGLMPNTMVRFEANCLACTPGQLLAMRQTHPVIVARGTMLEGDPRVSALQRGAINALRLVGLFH